MDQPSTSSANKQPSVFEEGKKRSKCKERPIGPQTMLLLKRISRKIDEEMKSISDIPLTSPINRMSRYTGIHNALCIKVEEMLSSGKELEIDHKLVERHQIHKELISMYLDKNTIPTITQLYDAVYTILSNFTTIDDFKVMLLKMGYVFYKFPNQKALRVMEKKSVAFERYKYLKRIQKYRSDNVPIFYIGIAAVNCNDIVYVNTNKTIHENMAQKFFFTVTEDTIDYIYVSCSITHLQLVYWLTDLVSHDVREGTVFVLNDLKITKDASNETPTLYSTKVEMVNWLDDHGIQCDVEMPKGALMNLIENCADTHGNNFELDNLLKQHNHKLLRLPESINGLSIASLLVNHIIEQNITIAPLSLKQVLQKVSVEKLRDFSIQVQQMERKYLEEELKVDNILDELTANTKRLKTLDADENEDIIEVPTFWDSD